MFKPKFIVTSSVAKALMDIEVCRQAVIQLPLSISMLESLRKTAKLLSTHFSTQIEGNKLSPSQVQEVLGGGGRFPGRKRDEVEVKHYYAALEFVMKQSKQTEVLREQIVRTIHGFVIQGRSTPTPYRDGQNVIRDGRTGAIVYLPPEAKDVAMLMEELIVWINRELARDEWPVPVIAGLAHYQFATIHPYYDGNGRTARLLTNLILHRGGYGLHGIYSLEEYYALHLQDYYDALQASESHNYYEGRAHADVTPFLTYFTCGMADSFARIRSLAEQARCNAVQDHTPLLRELTEQQRRALSLFVRMKTVRSKDVAKFFGISTRSASQLCLTWVKHRFLTMSNPSKKARRYQLSETYETLITST